MGHVIALANGSLAIGSLAYGSLANGSQPPDKYSDGQLAHRLGVAGGSEPSIGFELLVALVMSEKASQTLRELNPQLSEEDAAAALRLTAVVMLRVNRISQVGSRWDLGGI